MEVLEFIKSQLDGNKRVIADIQGGACGDGLFEIIGVNECNMMVQVPDGFDDIDTAGIEYVEKVFVIDSIYEVKRIIQEVK